MNFNTGLFVGKPEESLRRAAARILSAAVAAVDPDAAVTRHVRRRGDVLTVGDHTYDLRKIGRIFVVGAGKAGAPMARALKDVLGDRITAGIVNVKYGYRLPVKFIEIIEAGHPLPDAAGMRGAGRILELVSGAGTDDLVICVLSGGGSALLPLPVEGVTLDDKVRVTDLLLKSGATIQEINAVRKHVSRIKGGQLARAAAPARLAVLILSDVLGNPLDAIASGPTVPDPTTYRDARAIIARYGLDISIPSSVREHFRRGAAGEIPETPKPGDPVFRRVVTVLVGSNELAVSAAAEHAATLGFGTTVLSTHVEGEASDAARLLTDRAAHIRTEHAPAPGAICLIEGGETTVTVRGRGKGGRCQEFALAAALEIAGWPRSLIVGFGTDGTDGPTDAAGAMADGTTVSRARALGLDARRLLENNDAYSFFAALGDLIMTGPTLTNVNDLYLAIVGQNEGVPNPVIP